MKEFGERAAGSTALLHWWNEAELRQRPHSPARSRALRYGARMRKPAASQTRLAVEACWNLCIPVAPFSIKHSSRSTSWVVCLVRARCACRIGACSIEAGKAIPHMVAELWLRTPLH